MEFEWDKAKSVSNKIKHNVSFEEALSCFSDPLARIIADPDHSLNEQRYILLGMSFRFRLLVTAHTIRSDHSIRIISARKADKSERLAYEEFYNA